MKKKKVYVTLQNGDVFCGERFGADGEITGELVFSTGMVGYVETLTEPANFGQIVVQTFPLIGNYGVNESDAESEKAWVSAYIVRELCDKPSNFRLQQTLEEYLKKQGVIGISGVDTRRITQILREEGVMNARISDKPLNEEEIKALACARVKDAVKTVAPTEKQIYGDDKAKYTVALWNLGAKKSTIDNLVAQGCKVISLPACSSAEEILSVKADGVVISGGAGAPEDNGEIVAEIKKVLGKTPVLGLDFGHLLTALAFGAKTKKHKYGHRGGNQPVKRLEDGRVYISSQNHGYEVVSDTVTAGKVSFVNVNDGSCEGIDYEEKQALSVQFTPECCTLGNDKNPVYEKFFALMKKEK